MALAAIPAYLLARRVSSHGWSLAVAALTALAPWTGYATLMTTEALFYPAFVTLAWVAAGMLERPTWRRQAASLALAAVAALIKPQAFVLLPAIATAIVVFVATSSPRPPLRRYGLALGGLGTMIAAAAVILLGSRNAPGGAYGPLLDQAPALRDVLEWTVWHVAVFALALGIVALMAFPAAVARLLGRDATTAERSLGATAAAISAWVLVSVVALSASPYGLGFLHERSLFFLAPLVLACLAHWLGHGLPRRRAVAVLSALAVVAAIAALPERFVERSNVFDYPALRPVAVLLEDHPSIPPHVWLVGAALLAAAIFLATRSPVAPIACVVVAFVALAGTVSWPDAVSTAEARRLAWVDEALPGSARALLLHVDLPPVDGASCGRRPWFEQQALGVWTEFFNTRIDRVAHVYGQNEAAGIPSPGARRRTGRRRAPDRRRAQPGSALRRPRLAAADRRDPATALRPRSGGDPLPRRRLAVALARRGAAAARSPALAAAAARRRPALLTIQGSSSRYAASCPRAAASQVNVRAAREAALDPRGRVAEHVVDRDRDRLGIGRIEQPCAVAADLADRAGVGSGDGAAARHRLERREREALVEAREDERGRAPVQGDELVARHEPARLDAVRVGPALVAAAGEHEPQLRALAPQERERLQQPRRGSCAATGAPDRGGTARVPRRPGSCARGRSRAGRLGAARRGRPGAARSARR